MIISASRRTDIPAFFSNWFYNRIQAGYCVTTNPFNSKQQTKVSLHANDVDAFVFWTKNPDPMMDRLFELDERGYLYYFLYTLTAYDKELEVNVPSIEKRINTFKKLADKISPEKVIWRYDPIIIGNLHSFDWHLQNVEHLAKELNGFTNRLVISFADYYKKTIKNLNKVNEMFDYQPEISEEFGSFVEQIRQIAQANSMLIQSCAETRDLGKYGISRGKCIDDELIEKITGKSVTHKKDPHQRKECGCAISKDIGAYNTCLYNCRYCYATTSHGAALENHKNHFPNSASLTGKFDL